MSDSDRLWKLEGFPEHVGPASGEVQRAYELWKDRCQVNPQSAGRQLESGDRYTALIPGGRYVDDAFGEQQLICDYEIKPGSWGTPGEVMYLDCGFVGAADQPD
ncbi:hypothetical protein ACTOB_004067 [Actinoplanes oblitus]|uniref:Uncharacterized protein n=1 Tax=Actinoplanes oblitus TaxID=3040509 RepID=A0ABY8WTN0_9ACTN|nr:hypothetical protein [Actinoplanes oblitus]WIN00367.1 hypothetical protein ACTOB_004067 [Actinoplanes oblitus]